MKFFLKNTFGAFADAAILFPLLALLSSRGGMSGSALLLSAGLAYIVSGLIFRVPMSVQPLKSIAIASVAMGASALEVRFSGALLGMICLAFAASGLDHYFERVPKSLIHSLQVGLGALLLSQGFQFGWHWLSFGILALILFLPSHWSAMGFIATLGLLWGLFHGGSSHADALRANESLFRAQVWIGLVVPQLFLTLANSVVSTRDVAERYFGPRAFRVSVRRLLYSIGIGNILSATFSGLPYCHGSGGVTAHVRGGATHWISNLIIGASLIGMAALQFHARGFTLQFPEPILAALLLGTGIFHMALARPTYAEPLGKLKLAAALSTGIVTRSMIGVLLVAVLLELGLGREKRYA